MGRPMCSVDFFFYTDTESRCIQQARGVILLYSGDLDNCFQLWNTQHDMNLLEQVQRTRRMVIDLEHLWCEERPRKLRLFGLREEEALRRPHSGLPIPKRSL